MQLDPGASVRLAVDDAAELGFYVLDGALAAPGQPSLGPGMLAILSAGSQVTLSAADRGPASVAVIGGLPAEKPILFSGPFVMDTPEHLRQAKHDYSSGKMGRLDGVPF